MSSSWVFRHNPHELRARSSHGLWYALMGWVWSVWGRGQGRCNWREDHRFGSTEVAKGLGPVLWFLVEGRHLTQDWLRVVICDMMTWSGSCCSLKPG